MLAAYTRAVNILALEEKKDGTTYNANTLKSELLVEKTEQSLLESLAKVQHETAQLFEHEKFTEAMQQFSTLKSPLDAFFNDIMVNDKNHPELRANRLSLLACIKETMHRVADFSQITG
jgi:glycyl-tRNA synthetase beta chain